MMCARSRWTVVAKNLVLLARGACSRSTLLFNLTNWTAEHRVRGHCQGDGWWGVQSLCDGVDQHGLVDVAPSSLYKGHRFRWRSLSTVCGCITGSR
jgi:hypothetical protein